jgi:hypothetical protein
MKKVEIVRCRTYPYHGDKYLLRSDGQRAINLIDVRIRNVQEQLDDEEIFLKAFEIAVRRGWKTVYVRTHPMVEALVEACPCSESRRLWSVEAFGIFVN